MTPLLDSLLTEFAKRSAIDSVAVSIKELELIATSKGPEIIRKVEQELEQAILTLKEECENLKLLPIMSEKDNLRMESLTETITAIQHVIGSFSVQVVDQALTIKSSEPLYVNKLERGTSKIPKMAPLERITKDLIRECNKRGISLSRTSDF